MSPRIGLLVVLILLATVPVRAQVSQDARFAILGNLVATEGASRVPMPLGKSGVELSENGINRDKLQKEIASNGHAIGPGQVVIITAIEFNDKSIEFEIDGGGTKKKSILSQIQVGMGGASTGGQQPKKDTPEPKGSKVTLLFASKVPPTLTVEQLKDLLNPVLDFSKQSLARTGIEALPPEFQEAVKAKEAAIGMDSNTVLLAMGQPNKRIRNKNAKGDEQEDWLYTARGGQRQTFVTFEKDIVVEIRRYN